MPESGVVKHYFVDEAGDLNLLTKHGKIAVGREGVSHCFFVGLVDVPDPTFAHSKLEVLRQKLLVDPRYRDVPSMQPEAKKTALVFHAKDDHPDVRLEVFRLLPSLGAKAIVAIRRKKPIAQRQRAVYGATRRKFDRNAAYDELVSRIFEGKLHSADENRITFARYGKSNREPELEAAILRAKRTFDAKKGKRPDKPTTVNAVFPHESAGLQVADYYLWALQRMYEREDDRFFEMVAPQYRLTMDLDDKRNKRYGEWYSDSNKLKLAKIKPVRS